MRRLIAAGLMLALMACTPAPVQQRGYRGDGPPPVLPSSAWDEVALAYRNVFERLTGEPLVLTQEPIAERIVRALTSTGLIGN